MIEQDIRVPAGLPAASVEAAVERACQAEGLILALKGTLAKYPGSVHWHWKRRREPGTLEVTFWPETDRAWFAVQAGRTGEWIEASMRRLDLEIERSLKNQSPDNNTENSS